MADNLQLISQIVKAYQDIKKCKRRIAAIDIELKKERIKLHGLSVKVEEEYKDVLRIEKQPVIRLFNITLKNNIEQLEKENQEYLIAALNYNESLKIIEILEYEKKILSKNITGEASILKELDDAVKDLSIVNNDFEIRHYVELNKVNLEIKNILQLKIESQEALAVAKEVESNFKKMIGLIIKAKKYDHWGEFEAERIKGTIIKQSYIDKALSHKFIIKKLFLYLKDELKDVEAFQKQFEHSEAIIMSINVSYYNNMISDWIQDLNLSHTSITISEGKYVISTLIKSIKSILKTVQKETRLLEKKRAKMIENIVDI